MTAQEKKAKELVEEFYNLNISCCYENEDKDICIGDFQMLFESAKECALKVVNEILKNENNLIQTHSQNDEWLQIKEIIQNLKSL